MNIFHRTLLLFAFCIACGVLACGGGVGPSGLPSDGETSPSPVTSEPAHKNPGAASKSNPATSGSDDVRPAVAAPSKRDAPQGEPQTSEPFSKGSPATSGSDDARPAVAAPSKDGGPQVSTQSSTKDRLQEDQPQVLVSFEPKTDGFSFANFSGGSGAASIRVNDLVELFGVDGLCISGDSGICVPYPGVQLFLGQLNGVLANGLCYGISASVSNHFAGEISLSDLNASNDNVVGLSRNDPLDHSIAKLHMMQFSEEYRDFLDSYIEMRPDEIAEKLLSAFDGLEDRLTPPYTLALYSAEGGHSITPIGVEQNEVGYRVFVYDSNWPKETRWVDIDSGEGSWSYQALLDDKDSKEERWTGQGAGSMTLIPHTRPDSGFHCFFCQTTGMDSSKGTGSVIIVNTRDIKNTEFEISSEDGGTMRWTTAGRSPGMSHIKTYLLPSATESKNSGGDTLLVFIPSQVSDFEVDLNLTDGSAQNEAFGFVLAGPGIPTIVAKGSLKTEVVEEAISMLVFSKDATTSTVMLAIDSQNVETIETATLKSTTFVEPAEAERYEAIVVENMLYDVKVVQTETSEVLFSLKTTFEDTDTPLRSTDTGDGLRFFKFADGSVKVESPDDDVITKSVDAGYQVSYSDGTAASFEINAEGAMIGVFSNGSTSIRFEGGRGIHSTADGWIIDESQKGVFEVFREVADGIFETPSIEALDGMMSMAPDAKDMMRSILQEKESAGSDTEGSVIEDASTTAERWGTMTEKLGFMNQVNEAVSENQSEDVGMASILRNMFEVMYTPVEATEDADTSAGDMPSSDDMPDMDMGDMDMGDMDMGDMDMGDMDMPDMDMGDMDMPDMDMGDMDMGDMDMGDMDMGDMDMGDMDMGDMDMPDMDMGGMDMGGMG
jgi:hypothetical protein